MSLLEETKFAGDRGVGLLLYSLVASGTSVEALKHRSFIAQKIIKGDLKNDAQVQAAIRYVEKTHEFKEAEFDYESGVGITVPNQIIIDQVASVIQRHKDSLSKERYNFNTGILLKELREFPELRWADRKFLKDNLDSQLQQKRALQQAERERERQFLQRQLDEQAAVERALQEEKVGLGWGLDL